MKLNYKKTFLVGLAFFLICAFWSTYDSLVALTLTNKYGMSHTLSGVIMALDNILALFMLPLFGALSDKADGKIAKKFGKRTPFIVIGTVIAVVCFFFMSVADAGQATKMQSYSNPQTVSSVMWEENREIDNPYFNYTYTKMDKLYKKTDATKYFDTTIEKGTLKQLYIGEAEIPFENLIFPASSDEKLTDEQKKEITAQKQLYSDLVIPVRDAYAKSVTMDNPASLIAFIAILFFALLSMATFRSPAVALMPAITIKPLRSKANAIINIMGVIGGSIILGLGMVIGTGNASNALMSYIPMIGITCIIMVVALIVFILTVREPKLCAEMEAETAKYGLDKEKDIVVDQTGKQKLGKARIKSLVFMMLSIMFWFFGYNAVTSKYSVYASVVLNVDFNFTLLIAQIAALIAFFPAGLLASKIGRKKTIMGGIIILTASFAVASFMGAGTSSIVMSLLFVLAGISWAAINVNSLPMVVELATGADVGKFTGFYYTASMAAQTLTPIISGALMEALDMRSVLFPYGAIFVALSFVTMIFVMHGDSKPEANKGLDALAEPEELLEVSDSPTSK
ncbi:MAG: MFS transporter [Clostridia bacterium]